MQKFSLILAVSTLLFGLLTYDMEAWKWGALSSVLYSLPLFSFISKNKLVRTYAIWFGLFLILQSILSYYKYQKYHHLTPNLHYEIDVQGDGLPGIQGKQIISTDSLGFRTTKPIDYQKPANGLRVFALGASTTESIYIDDHKTWTHLLQEKLSEKLQKPVEVVNASVSGLRLVHILDNFKKILNFHPDVVVFLIGVNDWNKDILSQYDKSVEKLNRLYSAFGLEYYEVSKLYLRNSLFGLAIQSLPFKKQMIESGSTEIKVEKGEYYTSQNNTLSKKDVRKYEPTDIILEYRTYLEKTSALCKRKKIRCVFLTQPNAYKAETDEKTKQYFWMTPPNEKYTLDMRSMIKVAAVYNSKLKEFAKNNSVALCDLDQDIPPSLDSFHDEVHFNEKGSVIVANKLADCLAGIVNTSR